MGSGFRLQGFRGFRVLGFVLRRDGLAKSVLTGTLARDS